MGHATNKIPIYNKKNALLLLLGLFLGFHSTSWADPKDIMLARGGNLHIRVNPNEKIHFTNRNIIRVKDLGDRILVTGLKLGYTSMVTGKVVQKISVVSVEAARSYDQLKHLVRDFKGLTLEAGQKMAVVRGDLLRFSDWLQLAEASDGGGLTYNFEAKMDEEVSEKVRIHLRQLFARSDLPPIPILLDGPAKAILPKEFDSRQNLYKQILSPFGIPIEKDKSTIALAPMVEVEILVAEVRRSFMRSFGVSWPEQLSAKVDINGLGGSIETSIELALKAMEAKGSGRILASPKLLCRSGKEAEFLAGGEYPLAIKHRLQSEVVWKKHGVILKVKPLADLSGRMSIDIETEVSVIQQSEGKDELPNFRTNRIKTHFDLEGTRTIALSGLLKSVDAEGKKGIPLLSDLPILGSLFSSRDYLEERTELVFFVTPKLVPYDARSIEKKIPNWEPL